MRTIAIFVAGAFTALAVQTAITTVRAQDEPTPGGVVGLNHVGLSVPNVSAAAKYYVDTMGFIEAFRNDAGTSIYLQVSRDTFLELQQSNERNPVGITHFGLHVGNIATTVDTLRRRGATASDPRGPSAFSGAILANVTDPNGFRIELAELGPDSLQRKAMNSWTR
jgi:catechol 2,3-dioxygenase-like lactoylglutathione lyase family enzyme